MEQVYGKDKYAVISKTEVTWKPLLRQMFVCSGVTLNFFIYGLFFGAPAVLVPQLRARANSTAVTMETASWLVSSSSYGSLPWTLIMPLIAERFGRKPAYVVLWVNTLACGALFYFSSSVTELMVSGVLQGMLPGTTLTVAIMVLTEYVSPKYRGVFIAFKSATFFWGIWVSNAIGTFLHWKYIGVAIFVCCVCNVSTFFWPESPVWLATKRRFEECEENHRWLKGDDAHSEEELKELIHSQRESQRETGDRLLVELYKSVTTRRFYKPLVLCVLTTCLYHFSGKLACTGYVIDIIKTISTSESTAYRGMLVLDGVTVLGMYVGVFLNKVLKRRTLLFGSATLAAIFLFSLSLYLYLIHLNVILERKLVTLSILTGFSVTVSCGPMIMCMCLSGEITPLKCRGLFLSMFALSNNAIMATTLKLFPYVFKYFKSRGTFLFHGVVTSFFICVLYKVLPETKNKTILEIEKYFADDKVVREEVELMSLGDKKECNVE